MRKSEIRRFEEVAGERGWDTGGQEGASEGLGTQEAGVRLAPERSLVGKSRRRGQTVQGLQAKGRVGSAPARGTHRAHDAHDALPQQPRVDVIGAFAAALGEKDGGEGPGPAAPPAPAPGRVPEAAAPSAPPRWE